LEVAQENLEQFLSEQRAAPSFTINCGKADTDRQSQLSTGAFKIVFDILEDISDIETFMFDR